MSQWKSLGIAFLSLLGWLVLAPAPARAEMFAASLRSNAYQGAGYHYNLGWEFTTNDAVTVTKLGWFDFTFAPLGGTPGLTAGHAIGIFTLDGQLLVSGAVGAGVVNPLEGPPVTNTAGDVTGGFRYVAVTPTTLDAGRTYVIAGTNPLGSNDAFAVSVPLTDLTLDPALQFVQGRISPFGTGDDLLFPTIPEPPAVWNARNFGPNFQFAAGPAVPEPAGLVLAAVGILGVGAFRHLRARVRGAPRS